LLWLFNLHVAVLLAASCVGGTVSSSLPLRRRRPPPACSVDIGVG